MTDGADIDAQPTRAQRMKRDVKRLIMQAAKASGVLKQPAVAEVPGIPILCYHGIWMGDDAFSGDAMFMRLETFVARMVMLDRLGFTVVSLDDAVAALAGGPAVPEKSAVITIDDGWYSTYQHMMPALLAHGFPATLYCDSAQLQRGGVVPHMFARYVRKLLGQMELPDAAEMAYMRATVIEAPHDERIAALAEFADLVGFDLSSYQASRAFEYMSLSEMRVFSDAGFDVQLHTHNHTMGDLSVAAMRDELAANRAALSTVIGAPEHSFRHFCYPSGVKDQAIADALRADGIVSATTTVMDIARVGDDVCLLPRILDGDNMSEIEFEAELTGFAGRLRRTF